MFGMTLDIRLQNLLDQRIIRPRDIFDGDRRRGLIERQLFERQRGRRLSFILSDTF